MAPDTAERRPTATGGAADDAHGGGITQQGITHGTGRKRPPLAPASVFAPDGRRRRWHFTYPCRVCGSYNFGRSRMLADVTGLRRATCGHLVSVAIFRTYAGPSAERPA
jgi:hypothetical protein